MIDVLQNRNDSAGYEKYGVGREYLSGNEYSEAKKENCPSLFQGGMAKGARNQNFVPEMASPAGIEPTTET